MRNKYKVGLITAIILLSTGCSCSSDNKQEDHKHVYSDEWSFYSGGHFRKCTYKGCTVTSKVENHTFDEDDICTVCGYTAGLTKKYDACNHKWSMWEEIESPTCTEWGVKERYCEKCGSLESEKIDVDLIDGHFWLADLVSEKEATCQEEGYTGQMYCKYCYTFKEGRVLSKTKHEFDNLEYLKPGVTCSKCLGCKYFEYVFDISSASGYHIPQMTMIETTGENSMSTWDVSGLIKSGTYNVKLEICLTYSSYKTLKWYNMAKPELCINNEVEDINGDFDNVSDDDFRFYLKINDSCIYPNVTKNWEDLGYSIDGFKYGDFIYNVSLSNVKTISLVHGNNKGPAKIRSIKFEKA